MHTFWLRLLENLYIKSLALKIRETILVKMSVGGGGGGHRYNHLCRIHYRSSYLGRLSSLRLRKKSASMLLVLERDDTWRILPSFVGVTDLEYEFT